MVVNQGGPVRPVWLIAVILLAACGQDAAPPISPLLSTTTSPTMAATVPTTLVASTTAAVTTTLPYQWPDHVTDVAEFWASLRMTGGFEIYLFRTLEELADSATIVVVAVAVAPGPSATIGGDPDNNEVTSVPSLVVEIKEVVRTRTELLGIHTPIPGEQITVITNHTPRTALSPDPVLLFLQAPGDDRNYFRIPPEDVPPEQREYYTQTLEAWEAFKADKYTFFGSQALLAGDDTTTVSPWMPAKLDLLSISGTPIAEIVDRIRSMPPPEA
jgi:hypothetical protein